MVGRVPVYYKNRVLRYNSGLLLMNNVALKETVKHGDGTGNHCEIAMEHCARTLDNWKTTTQHYEETVEQCEWK